MVYYRFLWYFNRCFKLKNIELSPLRVITSPLWVLTRVRHDAKILPFYAPSLFLITFNTSDFNRLTSLILWNRSKHSIQRFTLQQSQQRIPPLFLWDGSFDAHRCSWHDGSFALGRVGQWKYLALSRTRSSPSSGSSALSFTAAALVDVEFFSLLKLGAS